MCGVDEVVFCVDLCVIKFEVCVYFECVLCVKMMDVCMSNYDGVK